MLKLIAIVGTNSKRSTNRQLLQYMQKHFAEKAEIELVEIKDIPVFNKPADKQVPAEILEILNISEEQINNGQTFTNEEVNAYFEEWLKD